MGDSKGANFTKTKKRERSTSRNPVKRFKGDQEGDNAEDRGSKVPRDKSGVRDPETRKKIRKMEKKMQRQKFGVRGKAGESDRKITTKMPKHLFAGKRKMGKTDRR